MSSRDDNDPNQNLTQKNLQFQDNFAIILTRLDWRVIRPTYPGAEVILKLAALSLEISTTEKIMCCIQIPHKTLNLVILQSFAENSKEM